MDSESDIPDEKISTNDRKVNREINRLRPDENNPASSTIPNFQITVEFPEEGIPLDRIVLPTRRNIKTVTVTYTRVGSNRPRPLNNGEPIRADKPIRFPNTVTIVQIEITVTEKFDNKEPIYVTLQVWGCFKPEETTLSPTTLSGSVSSEVSTSSYLSSPSSSPSTYSSSSPGSSGIGSSSSSYSSVSESSVPSTYSASTGETSSASSGFTTPCTETEGMDSPLTIGDKYIVIDEEEAPDISNIRPSSKTPFEINKNTALIKVWLMSVPVSSVELVTSNNVESMTVWVLNTRKVKTLIVSDANPRKPVNFDKNTVADDIIVRINRNPNSNRPMKVRLAVHGCFEEMTTTPEATTSSYSSSSIGTYSSSGSSSGVSSSPSYESSTGLSTGSSTYSSPSSAPSTYSSASGETSGSSGVGSTSSYLSSPSSSPSTYSSSSPGTSGIGSSSSSYSSVSESSVPSTYSASTGETSSASSGTSTPECTVTTGMDSESDIPDEMISTNDRKVNREINRLRPQQKNPASSTVPNFQITVEFPEEGIPLDRIVLPTRRNIKTVTVTYTRVGSNRPRPLNDGKPIRADKPIRFPNTVTIVRIEITVTEKFDNKEPIYVTLQVWGCFKPEETTLSPTTVSSSTSSEVTGSMTSEVSSSPYVSSPSSLSSSGAVSTSSYLSSPSSSPSTYSSSSPGIVSSSGSYSTGEESSTSSSSSGSLSSSYSTALESSVPSTYSSSTGSISGTGSSSSSEYSSASTSSEYSSASSSSEYFSSSSTTATTPAACLITTGMDSHNDIPDDMIRTNDKSVNRRINRLRPQNKNPARTHKSNFKITVSFPEEGIPLDRIALPTNRNIKSIVVTYTPRGGLPEPVEDGQKLPAKRPVKFPNDVLIVRIQITVVEKFIPEDPILVTLEVWGCFKPGGSTTPYHTTGTSTLTSSPVCEAVDTMNNPAYLPPNAIECNDPSITPDRLMPNNPKGPAMSYVNKLQITISFDGGAALDRLSLPDHSNILTIVIQILLPGETSYIPYMDGLPIPVSDGDVFLPQGVIANQIIIIVLEKLDPDQPIFITINIWACFDFLTSPTPSSTTATTPPICDVRTIDYTSGNVLVGASSEMPAAKSEMALSGSGGFWSPAEDDEELSPYIVFQIVANNRRASVYKVAFTLRFSKNVFLSLYNRRDKNVDTSDKIRCVSPNHHKYITYNFFGQVGDKIYIYVTPTKRSQPQLSNVEIHACYEDAIETTPTIPPTTTEVTTAEVCEFKCEKGNRCIDADQVCDGECDCRDCSDEKGCAPTDGNWTPWTPWSMCGCDGTRTRSRQCNDPPPSPGGKNCKGPSSQTMQCRRPKECRVCKNDTEPVIEDDDVITCGGFVGAQCPDPDDVCTLYPKSTLGVCCRPVVFTTPVTTPFTTPSEDGNWGEWSPWTRCSRSCGNGTETRRRECDDPPPSGNGRDCRGRGEQSRTCKKKDCTGPPAWSPWTPWSECDVHCGTGQKTRVRYCDSPPPTSSDEECNGPDEETVICHQRPCQCTFDMNTFENIFGYAPPDTLGWTELDGEPGLTSPDEEVNVDDSFEDGVVVHVDCSNCTCDEGVITCELGDCEECMYTKWSAWTDCSKSCDIGQTTRSKRLRKRKNQPAKCKPVIEERKDCNVDPCPTAIPPMWSPWSPWSECSTDEPCAYGTMQRSRDCSIPPNSNCLGDGIETKPCHNTCPSTPEECPGDTVWSECANKCPHTCMDYRLDVCDDETYEDCMPGCTCVDGEVMLGDQCVPVEECPCYDEDGNVVLPGFSIDKGPCESCKCENGSLDCSKDPDCCHWNAWGPWGECSESCGESTRNRYRTLNNGDPYECGPKIDTEDCRYAPCPADCVIKGENYFIGDIISETGCDICYCTTEGEDCQPNENSIIDGEWSAWTDWSQCSKSCRGGRETRTRLCNDPLPACGGDPCSGNNTQTRPCNRDVSCCDVTAWSDWSECSATCDTGVRTRTREFVNPEDKKECQEILQESTVCKEHDCDAKCNVTKWSPWSACSESCGTGKKTRTRDIRGRDTGDCPPLTDNQNCYESDCPCGMNEVYSNYTLCEQTCDERFEPVDSDCEDKLRPGCVCDENYYRDDNGDCVSMGECNKCMMDGVPRDSGETWTPADDECSVCECVAGEVKCTPVCEIPTCTDGEVLSYDVPNKCCPRCIKRKDTCRLYNHTDFLLDVSGRCKSISKVLFTYCEGGCGDSSSTPRLVMGDDRKDMLEQDCRCCTGKIGSYIPVKVICNKGVQQTVEEALLPKLVDCKCEQCQDKDKVNRG